MIFSVDVFFFFWGGLGGMDLRSIRVVNALVVFVVVDADLTRVFSFQLTSIERFIQNPESAPRIDILLFFP